MTDLASRTALAAVTGATVFPGFVGGDFVQVPASAFDTYINALVDAKVATHLAASNPHNLGAGDVGALTQAAGDARYWLLSGGNTPFLGALRNMLLNATFAINQRGFAGGALSAGIYGHDRWKADTGGANYSVSGETVTLTSGTIVQVIEAPNLAGATITVSVEDPTGTVSVDVEGETAGIGAGSGRQGVEITVPSGSTGDITVKLSGTAVSFARPQLEIGTAATVFDRRHPGFELSLCQRYFFAIRTADYAASARMLQGNAASAATGNIDVKFPTTMRATPSFNAKNPGSFKGVGSSTKTVSSMQTNNNGISPSNHLLSFTTATDFSASHNIIFLGSLADDGALEYDAEL